MFPPCNHLFPEALTPSESREGSEEEEEEEEEEETDMEDEVWEISQEEFIGSSPEL